MKNLFIHLYDGIYYVKLRGIKYTVVNLKPMDNIKDGTPCSFEVCEFSRTAHFEKVLKIVPMNKSCILKTTKYRPGTWRETSIFNNYYVGQFDYLTEIIIVNTEDGPVSEDIRNFFIGWRYTNNAIDIKVEDIYSRVVHEFPVTLPTGKLVVCHKTGWGYPINWIGNPFSWIGNPFSWIADQIDSKESFDICYKNIKLQNPRKRFCTCAHTHIEAGKISYLWFDDDSSQTKKEYRVFIFDPRKLLPSHPKTLYGTLYDTEYQYNHIDKIKVFRVE